MKELDPTPIYYIYVHFCKDNGDPFYVGKGKGKRAFEKGSRRGEHWKRVAEKHGYTVGFALENVPEKEALSLEEFLIAQFRSEGFILVNHTDGGEGRSNREQTDKNKQKIRDFRNTNGRFPSRCNPEEERLCSWLGGYCGPASKSFDPVFRIEMELFGYGSHVEETQQLIRDFRNTNGRFPSQTKPEEKQLSTSLNNYCKPSRKSYDPSFRTEMVALGYAESRVEENKQTVRDFYAEVGRLPSWNKPEEKQLHQQMMTYCTLSHGCYDPAFRLEMESKGYGQRKRKPK